MNNSSKNTSSRLPLRSLALGLSLGLGIGLATKNVGVGIAVGFAFAAAFGAFGRRIKCEKTSATDRDSR